MTDRDRSQNYYERDKSCSRDRSWEYYDRNKSCRRKRSPKYYKNDHEREYYHTSQDHGNRTKYKDRYKDKYWDKFSVIVIDLMILMLLMVEVDHMVTDHLVEIDCEITVEMSIRRKIINIRESLEIIMKMPMRTGTVEMNINTNTEMKAII